MSSKKFLMSALLLLGSTSMGALDCRNVREDMRWVGESGCPGINKVFVYDMKLDDHSVSVRLLDLGIAASWKTRTYRLGTLEEWTTGKDPIVKHKAYRLTRSSTEMVRLFVSSSGKQTQYRLRYGSPVFCEDGKFYENDFVLTCKATQPPKE